MAMLKYAILALCNPLALIINKSFTNGIVPDKLKIAKILLFPKTGSTDDLNNWRPISILSVFSKIFEKLMLIRMLKFIYKHNLLFASQHGFRTSHSTNTAIIEVVDNITKCIDNSSHVAGFFIDICKAFDSLSHKILLNKLYHYGFRGISLDWFSNYLSHRYQYIQHDNLSSNFCFIETGVPQGSILGPILFLIYINDLPNCAPFAKFCLYADDTTIIVSHKTRLDFICLCSNLLDNISLWFASNKLALNYNKTNFMFFGKKSIKLKNTFPNFTIDDHILTCAEQVKFLGVYLDSVLSWQQHINYLCIKISKNNGLLKFSSNYLPTVILLKMYFAYIYPYLCYAICVWGSASKCHINSLTLLQKASIRIISHSHYLAHTYQLFCNLKLLSLSQLYVYNVQLMMHKIFYRTAPHCLLSLFQFATNVHDHCTRNVSLNFHSLFSRTTLTHNSFVHVGICFWNNLPEVIRTVQSFNVFKKAVLNSDVLMLS
jgi:retron-type reverse transcriptase